MKKLATTLGLFAVLAIAAAPAFAANAVRISQVYGGGGGSNTSATYNQDYVELFNNSGAPVNVGNWTVEYGSATGSWGSSTGNIFTFPANTIIQPCKYILIACGTVGTGSPNLPIAADFTSTLNIGQTNGKIALFNAVNSNLACGSELSGTLVDKISFGTGNCPEGTATAGLTVDSGAVRNGGGTVDTDNNSTDFTVTFNPVPRNSASAGNVNCLATPTGKSTWGTLKSIYR